MKWLDAWELRLTRLSEERFYFVLLATMAFLLSVLVSHFALGLHRSFLTIACDTAGIQTAVVNTLHGVWFRDTAYGGPNILGGHTTFVLLLVAPIYAIFPSVDTLYVLQILGVYSTVIPLYLVACEILGRPLIAFLIACAALACPLLLQMALAPVHPEAWISAAAFWSYYFYRVNRVRSFWASLIFAVCCGEMAALIYVGLGLALLFCEDGLAWRKRYGIYALAGGIGWMVFTMLVVFPLMYVPGQNNVFAYNYTQWGVTSPIQLLGAAACDPLKALSYLLSPLRWLYVGALVGLPLLLAFFSRRSFFLLAPFPCYFLMCDKEFFLYFHAYYFQFAFFAGWMGLLFFLSPRLAESRLGASALTMTAFLNMLVVCIVIGVFQSLGIDRDKAFTEQLHAVFKTIPADAGVYSPHRYSAYLSNRENMVLGDLYDENFDFKKMLDAKVNTTDVHPEQIDYIVSDLINDQCGWRQSGFNPEMTKKRGAFIDQLLKSGDWELFWSQNNVVILKRKEK